MKTPFIPTAMRCTKEQFEAIKPKLIERGCGFKGLDFLPRFQYVVNNYDTNELLVGTTSLFFNRTVYEEWDEEIFLRNLGGEEIKEASIEQLYKSSNDEADKWTKPTYDRGMMAATILGNMIAAGCKVDYELAQRHTDKLISQLNQTL